MFIVHINQCRYWADEFLKKVLVLGCDNWNFLYVCQSWVSLEQGSTSCTTKTKHELQLSYNDLQWAKLIDLQWSRYDLKWLWFMAWQWVYSLLKCQTCILTVKPLCWSQSDEKLAAISIWTTKKIQKLIKISKNNLPFLLYNFII